MSLIPLDEPRGDDASTPREGAPVDSVFGRLWGRLTSPLRALFSGPVTKAGTADGDESDTPALDPAESDRGATAAASRRETRRQEFVTTEEDEQLTLALADNPDAKITSDTWERVER